MWSSYAGAMARGRGTQNSSLVRRRKGGGFGGERALIDLIRRRAQAGQPPRRHELRLGIGDDCAILRPRPGEEIVVTTDFCLEGRHFRRDWHSPASAGHRTLARGLSDLAAMGARPVAAFLSLALPRSAAEDIRWIDGFLDGLLSLARRFAVPLAGGDTAESPGEHILADIVLLGAVPARRALRRDGARPGDRLFCTGALGGAAAELQQLAAGHPVQRRSLQVGDSANPQLLPEPRLAAGQALLRRGLATAAIDLSDGLSTDLRHLCEASGVAAEVDAASLPIHSFASGLQHSNALSLALNGGEDYELLFSASARAQLPRKLGGVPLTEIGRIVTPGRGRPKVALVDALGKRSALAAAGWEHLH